MYLGISSAAVVIGPLRFKLQHLRLHSSSVELAVVYYHGFCTMFICTIVVQRIFHGKMHQNIPATSEDWSL